MQNNTRRDMEWHLKPSTGGSSAAEYPELTSPAAQRGIG
jgi:hypothetical protein